MPPGPYCTVAGPAVDGYSTYCRYLGMLRNNTYYYHLPYSVLLYSTSRRRNNSSSHNDGNGTIQRSELRSRASLCYAVAVAVAVLVLVVAS